MKQAIQTFPGQIMIQQWGAPTIQALSRIWKIEADQKRHPLPVNQQLARRDLWEKNLDQAVALLGTEQLGQA
jgi:hypothetical protein